MVADRICEHHRSLRLQQPIKSAVAEHYFDTGHTILFDETDILELTGVYWDSVVLESITTRTAVRLMNRDTGFQFSVPGC